jgi:hypothetical protein
MFFSDLETMVNADMFDLGYDSRNVEHIKIYWEMMLNGD